MTGLQPVLARTPRTRPCAASCRVALTHSLKCIGQSVTPGMNSKVERKYKGLWKYMRQGKGGSPFGEKAVRCVERGASQYQRETRSCSYTAHEKSSQPSWDLSSTLETFRAVKGTLLPTHCKSAVPLMTA